MRNTLRLWGKHGCFLLCLLLFFFYVVPDSLAQRIVDKNPTLVIRPRLLDIKALEILSDKIVFTCDAPGYTIKDNKKDVLVLVKNFELTLSPGDPMLPAAIYEVALPPNVDPKSVTLNYKIVKSKEIPGKNMIKPAPPLQTRNEKGEIIQYWGESKEIVQGRNIKIYKGDKFFPLHPVTLEAYSQMRKWNFVKVQFIPIRYYPNTGKLDFIQSVSVTINYRLLKVPPSKVLLKDTIMDKEAESRFINYKQVQKLRWYWPADLEPFPAPAIADYVIITTNDIVANSNILTDFINHKTYFGHTVRVVTEDYYGALISQAPNGTAEKIRQWLIENYIDLGTKWVLLIGNPDPDDPTDGADTVGDVPMKMCWPHRSSSYYQNSPTDHFYANLSGDWDLDGDGFYGENTSIMNATSPDAAVDPETFSVRWTGQIEADIDGTYYFYIYSDEGIFLSIDGTTVIDNRTPHFPTNNSGSIALTTGMHNIQMEYFDLVDDGMLILTWRKPGESQTSIPADKLYHLSGGSYVSDGLTGEYFNNEDFTDPVFIRVDSSFNFYWGTGDNGAGGVDFTQDLYVGRIPVYNNDYAELDGILQKIITYETITEIPSWRRRILLPMKPSDASTPGYDLGENIKDDAVIPAGLDYYRVYEEEYVLNPPPEANPCTVANVLAEWVNGYGVTTWFTHGWIDSASSIFNTASCASLDDSMPALTFQASCYNGYPEDSTNLGYSLLEHGAIGTVSASRVSWYLPGIWDVLYLSWGVNQSMAYFYTKGILGGITAGQSLFAMKSGSNGWMNNMDYNLYGDPSASLFKTYEVADVDIVPVLDHSGSMGGYTSSSNTDKKIDILKEASHHFVDMMEGDAGHQFGLVKFSTIATTVHNLQSFTDASKSTIHALIDAIFPTNLTSIGDGLTHAVNQFTTNGLSGNRRVILLVTDGMENCSPWITDIQPDIISNDITVFPLGLGYSYGINETKLVDLANATGGDYRITDDDLIFRKYFIEILSEASGWSVVTDPIMNLGEGEEKTLSVNICSEDSEVIFTVYWSDYDNAVQLTMKAPSGNIYTADPAATTYTYQGKSRYAFYKFDFSELPAVQCEGIWTLQIKAKEGILPAGGKVRLSASVLAKDGAEISVNLDNPVIMTGDRNLIQVSLTHLGKPIKNALVQANIDMPKVGFGNIIRYTTVQMKKLELTSTPEKLDKDDLQLKMELIQKKLGSKYIVREMAQYKLYDDGTHGDRVKNDSIYSISVLNTKVPGVYNVHIVVSAEINGKKTTREWTKTFQCRVDIDPRYSITDLKAISISKKRNDYKLEIAPRDRFGNFLGSGHQVTIIGPDGKKINLKDNLDSTYTLDLSLTVRELAKTPRMRVYIDDKLFTEINVTK